jgi:hypothetical protein
VLVRNSLDSRCHRGQGNKGEARGSYSGRLAECVRNADPDWYILDHPGIFSSLSLSSFMPPKH